MRALILSISESELRERRARGADRWDEMWAGVLHMVPPPENEHQEIVSELQTYLHARARRKGLGRVRVQVSLFSSDDPEADYRVPDLTYVAAGNERVLHRRGIVGAADAVIEVRSPGDETYDKFPFFAGQGVREVVVIDARTLQPEVFRLVGRRYVPVRPSTDEGLIARVLSMRLRRAARRRKLRIEALDDPSDHLELG